MGIKVERAWRFYVAAHAAKSHWRMAVCSTKLVKPLGNLGCGAILHQKLPKLAPNCSGWWKLAHNMHTTCRHNMASFPAQLFCSSFYHHIALVCAKTQGPNAHLALVLDFFLGFSAQKWLERGHMSAIAPQILSFDLYNWFFWMQHKKLPVEKYIQISSILFLSQVI